MNKGNGEKSENKVVLRIGGMSCVKCVDRVAKSLKRIPGAIDVMVNLGAGSAMVKFDSKDVALDEIKNAIENAGYNYLGLVEQKITEQQKHLQEEAQAKKLHRIIAGFIGGALLMLLMYIPVKFYVDKSFIMLFLSFPFFVYISFPIYISAFKDISSFSLTMDVMYAMGISIAYFSSVLGTLGIVLTKEFMFYETAVFLASFLALGRYLEAKAKGTTTKAIENLLDLQPRVAFRLYGEPFNFHEENIANIDMRDFLSKFKVEEISVEQVEVNDLLLIKPGQKVPVDGTVLLGSSYIDESMVTGEPMPVLKMNGMQVIGGTLNKNSVLIMRANKIGKDTLLAQIVQVVEEAQNSRLPIQRIADKVVAYFIPAILMIAILVFTVWFFVMNYPLLFGLTVLISVLVIACPCALGLATPMAIMVGIGKGAERGILVRDGEIFERTDKLSMVVFDKTGTLTKGKPHVVSIKTLDLAERDLLQIAASVEKNSQHPLGEAIVQKAKEVGLDLYPVENFNTIEGKGIVADYSGRRILVGSPALLKENSVVVDDKWKEIAGKIDNSTTFVLVAIDNIIKGIIEISDPIKDETKSVIEEIKKMGLKVGMMTGDNLATARSIAQELGIDYVVAELLPNDKASQIVKLKSKGEVIAFVGDGINDAPALAVADLGIALGSGTDIAIEAGDIVLVKSNLSEVITAIRLSKVVMSRIRKNLFWAFAYNLLLIPVAAGILYPLFRILLKPEIAGLAMALSSFTVVMVSRRIHLVNSKN